MSKKSEFRRAEIEGVVLKVIDQHCEGCGVQTIHRDHGLATDLGWGSEDIYLVIDLLTEELHVSISGYGEVPHEGGFRIDITSQRSCGVQTVGELIDLFVDLAPHTAPDTTQKSA